ncbi:MAG: hypothetical protein QM703_17200 [Gemmatales bacterium]
MNKTRLVRNMAGLAFALLLLVPVPALALTFLGSWNYFTATTPSGNLVPGASQNSTDNPNNYGLTIGMGFVDPPSNITKYSVTATRDFQITNALEFVRIAHSFFSYINNGSINVTITIQRYGVANDPFNFPPYSVSAGQTAPPGTGFGLDDFSKTGRLSQGLYRLSLTITYMRTPPNGSWNNSSPHVFTFQGL